MPNLDYPWDERESRSGRRKLQETALDDVLADDRVIAGLAADGPEGRHANI